MNTIAKARIALSRARENRKDINVPLLHLASGDIDTLSLTATAHGEVNIERGKSLAQVTLGNDVESSGVVENVIVKSEVTAGITRQSYEILRSACT